MLSNCWGMSCYVTIDATDPNIAAIRGLAPGPAGLARLGFTAAQHECLCRWLPPAPPHQHPLLSWQIDMPQTDSRDNILVGHYITKTCSFLSPEEHLSVAWLCGLTLETGGQFGITACVLFFIDSSLLWKGVYFKCYHFNGVISYLYKWFTYYPSEVFP